VVRDAGGVVASIDAGGGGDGDEDADGVLDRCDACPREPETYNGAEDEDGCPDCALPRDQDGVVFERGEAVLDAWSIDALQRFVELYGGEVERVAVVARAAADERGAQALSERRAAAVVAVLTGAGMERGRIEVVALGATAAPEDGRDAELLGRRTFLAVVREGGVAVRWEEGRVVWLMARAPRVEQPSPAGCPREARLP
jgi:OmpA family protein